MKLKIISLFLMIFNMGRCHQPPVHEDVDDQIGDESKQNYYAGKGLNNFQKLLALQRVPKYNFNISPQMDLRQNRYLQQQESDLQNILKLNSSRISRKLRPAIFVPQNIDRQDQHTNVIYIQPNAIRARLKLDQYIKNENELNALNALVGQPPNVQLVGLRNLLQPLRIKEHTPIMENAVDSPHPDTKPNVLVDHVESNLNAIQAQLDLSSKEEAEKVLAKAQREAAAHVEAQHHAIAKARLEAQETLSKIAAQNTQVFKEMSTPIAISPHSITGMISQASDLEQTKILPPPQDIVLQPISATQPVQPTEDHIVLQPVALPLRSEELPPTYAPKHGLQKFSITKTHTVTQGSHSPNSFQEITLETQHQKENIFPPAAESLLSEPSHHQYASRYAFGYKIKDVKMGNHFGHEEKRDVAITKGRYHVLLPDGRLQTVEYYADDTGYHAQVSYENVH